jgi:hypothetical protein
MGSTKCFVLYGTSACHLCEEAEAVLAELLAQGYTWQIELVDIAEHDDLMDRYALSIPVLRDINSQQELSWPFDGNAVKVFVSAEEVS